MASVNKVVLVGNLGRDPEIRFDQAGNKVVSVSIATSDAWRDKVSGELKEKTEWHRVVIFNPHLCDIAEKYLRKGVKVYLEGQLQTREWTDQQGQKHKTKEIIIRYKGEITALTSPYTGEKTSHNKSENFSNNDSSESIQDHNINANMPNMNDFDDEIPF